MAAAPTEAGETQRFRRPVRGNTGVGSGRAWSQRRGIAVSDGFHLFVYGTLRSGGGAALPLLEPCTWLRAAAIEGTLYDIDGRFPALLRYGSARVQGEIWQCPTSMLRPLDEFEGVEIGLFRRIGVVAAGLACWTYVAGPALARELMPARRIASGDWLDRGPEVVTR